MKKALVEPSGRVAQVEPVPQGGGNPFPVALPLVWRDCADDVTTAHRWNGNAFALPQVPAPTRTELILQIERVRDEALRAGVSWNGRTWHTDPTFQQHITGIVGAFTATILPEGATVAIRAQDNTIHNLNVVQCKQLAGAVMTKVQTVWAESWAAKDALP